jgi:GWxTD domain-containing protein
MKRVFILLGLSLVFLLGCASGFKGLTVQQNDLLKPLVKAGASQSELDTLVMLIKTDAPENQIQNRVNLFWNNKYQALSDEEKVIYSTLADSSERMEYLSCKNRWERKLFLRKINKEQKEKLWETEQGRILYFSLKLVASKDEFNEFLRLPDSLREDWLFTFWKKKDSNPTTEENEFKQEFDGRVEYVLYNFWVPFGQLKPWDDRGDVYILYGEPDEILAPAYTFDRAEAKFGEFDLTEGIRGLTAEVWHYRKYGPFQFQEDRLIYRLAPYRRPGQDEKEAATTFFKTIIEKVELAKVEFIPDFGSPLDFPWNFWKFWNDGDYYNVRVNLSVPLEKLGLVSDSVSVDSGWLCFQERVLISDKNRKTVTSDSIWIRKKISKYLNRKDLLLADQYSCDSLAPGFYNIAVSIKDSVSNRMGIYQDTSVILVSHVTVKASEKISQLIMADSVWEADSFYIERNGTKFVRNGLVIKPRPGNVYLSGQAPSFYCEIYELKKDKNDSCSCSIDYYFFKQDKNGKSVLFQGPFSEQATYPSSSQPYIKGSLSPDKFPSGEYIIRIDVIDLNNPKAKKDETRKTVAGFKID